MSNRLFAINILLRTCPLMIDLEYAMDIYDSFFVISFPLWHKVCMFVSRS